MLARVGIQSRYSGIREEAGPGRRLIPGRDRVGVVCSRGVLDIRGTSETVRPVQRRSFKEMTPERRLEIAEMLYYSARELKAAAFRARHPEWTEEEIEAKVKEVFLYGRT